MDLHIHFARLDTLKRDREYMRDSHAALPARHP
jgi:hypothetical protein